MRLGLFLVTVCLVGLSSGPEVGSDALATGSSAVRWKLVYQRYDARAGQGGVGADVVSSSRRRPVTIARARPGSNDYYLFPQWSPDGGDMAFHARIDGKEGLYAIRADGTLRTQVASGDAIDFLWSPDSRRVAYVVGCELYSPSDGLRGCADGRIEVAFRNGSGRRVVMRPTGGRARSWIQLADWSPNGARLLALVRVAGRERLVSVDLRQGSTRTLADSRLEGDLGDASWSTDGSLIAYTRRCRENRDVFCDLALMRHNGGAKRLLVRTVGGITGPSYDAPTWLPGSSLLLVPMWGIGGHTRLVNALSSRSTTIAGTPWRSPVPSRDGRTIARFERNVGEPDAVILARTDGSVLERFRLPKTPSRDLSWGHARDYDLWIP